jgi:transcriptional regulator with XRE-family HTH domain
MLGKQLNQVNQDFGKVLRQLRKDAGLSQEKLALEAGLQRNYISMMELGNYQPTISTIIKLSKALKIKASKIIEKLEDQSDTLGDSNSI